MCLSPSLLKFNILCDVNVFTVWVRLLHQDGCFVLSQCVGVCVCYTCLCESAFISCIFDIYLAAWKICFIDCVCECAIKPRAGRSPVAWVFSECVSVCRSGVPGHLWEVWLLRHSWTCFDFNWLGYFVLCLREWEANTTKGNGIPAGFMR